MKSQNFPEISGNISMQNLEKGINTEKKIVGEISSLFNYLKKSGSAQEKKMISSQIESLINSMKKAGEEVLQSAEKISLFKPLNSKKTESLPAKTKQAPLQLSKPAQNQEFERSRIQQQKPLERIEEQSSAQKKKIRIETEELENLTILRFKKKEKKKKKKKEKKPSKFSKISSGFFYKFSEKQLKKGNFRKLSRDLVKSNMNFVPASYISAMIMSTIISVFVSAIIMAFFLFFSLVASPPFIVRTEEIMSIRFLKVIWILIFGPVITFLFSYLYPSLEKSSLETKINRELPFAVIHMSSISSSMIEPSKIFGIIVSTGEYPNIEKEFIKLQNEINIYGYDLVTALRNRAFNSPSRKLSELFNGLATTITSGGNLPEFFEKRSQTLLFDHRIEQEKQTKASETFMDIYISLVIAAPMILMLLLIMMNISGLGLSLNTATITLVMVLSVTLINVLFLAFLHLKQPGG